ncbi:hypothetical protein [Burkholderia cepacia]|uniref:hypothetical protein n=1 Tax=Burkholderia cepacia TaxID=292 RepID=UPI00158922AF|nr:hypothetical protein [Burkholderia cepacia]
MSVSAVLLSESIKPVMRPYLLTTVESDVNSFAKIDKKLTQVIDSGYRSGYRIPRQFWLIATEFGQPGALHMPACRSG